MAWFKGLAGKAEDFLNQIDQNAAVALQSDKKTDSNETLLTEVTWESQTPKRDLQSSQTPHWSPVTPTTIPTVRSSPNLNIVSSARTSPKKQNDEELISFLNSSEPIINVDAPNEVPQPFQSEVNMITMSDSNSFSPVKFETLIEKPQNHLNSESSQSSSRRSSPQEILSDLVPPTLAQPSSVITVEKNANGIIMNNHVSDINTENEMLRNELRTLNNEMSLLLRRAKKAEKDYQSQQILLSQLQERADVVNQLEQELLAARQQAISVQEKLRSLQVENEKLVQSSENNMDNETYRSLQEELENVKSKHKLEMTTMESRLQKMEQERQSFELQFLEVKQQMVHRDNAAVCLQQQMERARSEAQASREELDQYRLRAQRILQDKEKLINDLRGEGPNVQEGQDDTVILELQQLRQERELLREETSQVTARLQAVRDELLEAEKRLETSREQASETQHNLQERLSEERKKRQTAEEDCKTHAEELRSVRDELSRQRSLLASRVREREAELTRLRTQLAQRPASPTDDELESRLHALTQTLVQKQNTLETVTTEKNALRLQLEKMERKNQEMMTLLQQRQAGIINVNDTDDAKAQIPRFFVETPFDTGMTRRVKRAYSSLDAVSIRTGVFLRRYPLARILVLCYMVLLHLWVMLVLFTYTPQAQ